MNGINPMGTAKCKPDGVPAFDRDKSPVVKSTIPAVGNAKGVYQDLFGGKHPQG